MNKLKSLTSDTVIDRLRGHFVKYGISDTFISDNGSHSHLTNSESLGVYNNQSNGTAEAIVNIVKRLMWKCKARGLALRNEQQFRMFQENEYVDFVKMGLQFL